MRETEKEMDGRERATFDACIFLMPQLEKKEFRRKRDCETKGGTEVERDRETEGDPGIKGGEKKKEGEGRDQEGNSRTDRQIDCI